ncbi:MAG: Spy/CpxP family protein refolding chaperone [Alphaproteobacteria bacterium]|nr:Spy/CpxP family protein refolding chaperone [Alphaproteobacteria bacterium]MBV9694865.1 Spy/CpxP family protein refolding chaperone [Alphaproteobacteria bacterium]
MRSRLAAALFFVCLVPALADPAPGTIMKVTPPATSQDLQRMCHAHFEMEVASVGRLGSGLQLTAAQKPLFDAWRKAHLDELHRLPCPPLPMGLDTPAPQRMENEAQMAEATTNALRAELPAVRALYESLTAEQRAIFDGPRRAIVPPPAAPGSQPAPHP